MSSTRDDEIFSRIKKIAERLKREYKAEKVILLALMLRERLLSTAISTFW